MAVPKLTGSRDGPRSTTPRKGAFTPLCEHWCQDSPLALSLEALVGMQWWDAFEARGLCRDEIPGSVSCFMAMSPAAPYPVVIVRGNLTAWPNESHCVPPKGSLHGVLGDKMNKMFVILLELVEIEHNQVSLRLWPKKNSWESSGDGVYRADFWKTRAWRWERGRSSGPLSGGPNSWILNHTNKRCMLILQLIITRLSSLHILFAVLTVISLI